MSEQNIKCDKCGHEIELDRALSSKIEKKLRSELEDEKRKLWVIAQKKAAEKIQNEMRDLKDADIEKNRRIKEFEENELELRKKARELKEREERMVLDLERKMDVEREKIADIERKRHEEENRMKNLEKEKQMEQMRKTIEDLKRKSEQGSMQIQGDVQENDLKRMLNENFPVDIVEDVPTGIKGADLVHTVRSGLGAKAGVILWESKNTKSWSADWLKKLKDDQGEMKADLCILVSQVLPDSIEGFQFIDGVWVTDYKSVKALTHALRLQVLELSQVKASMVGRDEKMELMFGYLSSAQFKNRVENIVRAFKSLKEELEREKRSFGRLWSRREKEIDRVMFNTVGMYGDLQGIIGGALPTIENLELDDGE